MKSKNSRRAEMPLVAGFIDSMRDAFGADMINDSIRRGMAGECDFYARENGAEVGTKAPDCAGSAVSLAETIVGPMGVKSKGGRNGHF